MSTATIQPAYDMWSQYNRRLREVVGALSRTFAGSVQVHHRGSILQRLFSHDAYHCGELSQTLGINGLPQIDLWRPD